MMKFLDDDIVNLRRDDGSEAQFYWGDKVEILDEAANGLGVEHLGIERADLGRQRIGWR